MSTFSKRRANAGVNRRWSPSGDNKTAVAKKPRGDERAPSTSSPPARIDDAPSQEIELPIDVKDEAAVECEQPEKPRQPILHQTNDTLMVQQSGA